LTTSADGVERGRAVYKNLPVPHGGSNSTGRFEIVSSPTADEIHIRGRLDGVARRRDHPADAVRSGAAPKILAHLISIIALPINTRGGVGDVTVDVTFGCPKQNDRRR